MQFISINSIFLFSLLNIILGAIYLFYTRSWSQPQSFLLTKTQLISEAVSTFSNRIISNIIQMAFYVFLVLFFFSYIFDKPFYYGQFFSFFIGALIMCIISHINLNKPSQLSSKIIHKCRGYLTQALSSILLASIAFSMLTIGILILGFLCVYIYFGSFSILGYGAGIILSSYFLRVGGGMFKASSDIGSGVIHNFDEDIPRNDARSPATLLDQAADFIGNITGYGSDILSSYILVIIAGIILPLSYLKFDSLDIVNTSFLILIPFLVLGIGFLSTFLSFCFTCYRITTKTVSNVLLEGLYVSIFVSAVIVFYFLNLVDTKLFFNSFTMFNGNELFICFVIGLFFAGVIGFTSEVLTSKKFKIARSLSSKAEFGPVLIFIRAFGLSLTNNVIYLFYIFSLIIFSFSVAGMYGVAMSCLGMLSVTPYILMMYFFSTLSNNLYKLVKLSDDESIAENNLTKVNDIASTTVALGNGFVTGTTLIASFVFFLSILQYSGIDLLNIEVFTSLTLAGVSLGVIFPFFYSGILLLGLEKTIIKFCSEVVRQFKEIPFLHANKATPDMIKAADNISRASLDNVVFSGAITMLLPIISAYFFGLEFLTAICIGVLFTLLNLSFFSAHFGDLVHNAKHYIQAGNYGGRNTNTYSNISIVDNISDGFKDLISPSLNILIKTIVVITGLLILFLT